MKTHISKEVFYTLLTIAISLGLVGFFAFLFWFRQSHCVMYEWRESVGAVVSREFEQQIPPGFVSNGLEWGWRYTTDQGYSFKSQKYYEVGVELTEPRSDIECSFIR